MSAKIGYNYGNMYKNRYIQPSIHSKLPQYYFATNLANYRARVGCVGSGQHVS